MSVRVKERLCVSVRRWDDSQQVVNYEEGKADKEEEWRKEAPIFLLGVADGGIFRGNIVFRLLKVFAGRAWRLEQCQL